VRSVSQRHTNIKYAKTTDMSVQAKKKQVRKYYGSGTVDKNASWQPAAYAADAACRLHSSVGNRRPIDAYLGLHVDKEYSCQISSKSHLKRPSLKLFWRRSSQQEYQDEQQTSNMGPIPDPTKDDTFYTITLKYTFCSSTLADMASKRPNIIAMT